MNAPDMVHHADEGHAGMVLPEDVHTALVSTTPRVRRVAVDGTMAPMWAALAKAQGAFEPIEALCKATIEMKNGGSYSFYYADLAEVLAKTRKGLSDNGLSLLQIPHGGPKDGVTLLTILAHESGCSLECEIDLPRSEDIKQFGGYITYCRRYVVAPLLGVASTEIMDHDGSAPGDGTGAPAPNSPALKEHPDLKAAKTVGELSKAMSALSVEERRMHFDYFNHRQREIMEAARKAPSARQGSAE